MWILLHTYSTLVMIIASPSSLLLNDADAAAAAAAAVPSFSDTMIQLRVGILLL